MMRPGKQKAGKAAARRSKSLGLERPLDKPDRKKKTKAASIKNQIRAIQRLLTKKNLPAEAKHAQEQRLEDLKTQAKKHQNAELERKMALQYRRVKFFERRKIERRIKHLEKGLNTSDVKDAIAEKGNPDLNTQLMQLKEDLEYVRFFPKTEKYVSLFMGNEDEEVLAKRGKLRLQIKASLEAAAASGLEPDEMDSGDDSAIAENDDDFFLAGSECDDGELGSQFSHANLNSGALGNNRSKKPALVSAKFTLGSKKQQFIKFLDSTGSDSKSCSQKPAPTFRNESQRQEQVQTATRRENKIKEQMGGQKRKFLPRSNGPLQSRSQSLHPRRPPDKARSRVANNASYAVSLKKNPDNFTSSFANENGLKTATVQKLGSTDMDLQTKRRRKRRPKKKKA